MFKYESKGLWFPEWLRKSDIYVVAITFFLFLAWKNNNTSILNEFWTLKGLACLAVYVTYLSLRIYFHRRREYKLTRERGNDEQP